MKGKSKDFWVLWKHKSEDFESDENLKARTLSPMKDKSEDFESYESIKARTLSPMKDKSEDFESYER